MVHQRLIRSCPTSISIYGTFSTRQGKAKCTYEEKNFDDSWESQDDSTHFTVNGSFSIRDGKLSVTIDDED